MEPITILIVDDHPTFRQACKKMLEENTLFQVLACTGDAEEALKITREFRPDITLLDIKMSVSGFELASRIKVVNAEARIIGFSLYEGIQIEKKFMECGASGYVTKDASVEEITDAIIRVNRGESYFSK
jgi:DNA-binding NarL/FixJ family response regulator